MSQTDTAGDRAGEFDRFAVDCALDAAWATEFWIPSEPDYGFIDYFEAAAARNLALVRGFEDLAADIEQRGILPQTDSDQARLVTDGGTDMGGTERFPPEHECQLCRPLDYRRDDINDREGIVTIRREDGGIKIIHSCERCADELFGAHDWTSYGDVDDRSVDTGGDR